MIQPHDAKSLEPSLSFDMTTRSRRSASFTCSSSNKLKDARTYDVRAPFAKNTVPGSARTPPSKALVRMILSESPFSPRRSLNLVPPHTLLSATRSGNYLKRERRARKTSQLLGYSILLCRGGAVAWPLRKRRAWRDRMRLRF